MIQQLQAQHEIDRQQIEQFSRTQATYESLVERERKHAVEQYKKILEQRNKELAEANAARKSLEAEVAQLRRQRHPPRNEKKGRAPQMLNNKPNSPHQEFNGGIQQFNNPVRRPSRVPLPIRPSTPLRPNYARATSSGNNTISSSVDSLFSEKSLRSSSPESPISAKETEAPSLKGHPLTVSTLPGNSLTRTPLKETSLQQTSLPGTSESSTDAKKEAERPTRPALKTMRTWAEITSKPAIENASTITPLQTGTKKPGVLVKSIKT
jgi:hypothetical protein